MHQIELAWFDADPLLDRADQAHRGMALHSSLGGEPRRPSDPKRDQAEHGLPRPLGRARMERHRRHRRELTRDRH